MGDPFEDAARQSSSEGSSSLREPSVLQAVTFLNDPRVKGSDPSRALDFLRSKGITEDELREACRRVGTPFPHAAAPPFQHLQPLPSGGLPHYPPHLMPPVPYQQQRRGPSWVSVFLGITAAAGIYTALREVLRRYVVPMYFPDAARVAEERRRRDEMSLQAQELQIVELRERIQDLVASTKKTSEKVDNLSESITSSLVVREKELSQNSEIRDAIRQLSHSVTASGGTDTSRVLRDGASESASDGGYLHYLNGNQAKKQGSLAYSHVDSFTGNAGTVEESGAEFAKTPLAKLEKELLGSGNARSSTNVRGAKGGENAGGEELEKSRTKSDEDDFMAIAPAEVEDSWRTGVAKDEEDVGGKQVEAVGNGWGGGEEIVDEVERVEEDGLEFAETSMTRRARRLFESEVMNEAKDVLGGMKSRDGTLMDERKDNGRPVSMPEMEVALSDDE